MYALIQLKYETAIFWYNIDRYHIYDLLHNNTQILLHLIDRDRNHFSLTPNHMKLNTSTTFGMLQSKMIKEIPNDLELSKYKQSITKKAAVEFLQENNVKIFIGPPITNNDDCVKITKEYAFQRSEYTLNHNVYQELSKKKEINPICIYFISSNIYIKRRKKSLWNHPKSTDSVAQNRNHFNQKLYCPPLIDLTVPKDDNIKNKNNHNVKSKRSRHSNIHQQAKQASSMNNSNDMGHSNNLTKTRNKIFVPAKTRSRQRANSNDNKINRNKKKLQNLGLNNHNDSSYKISKNPKQHNKLKISQSNIRKKTKKASPTNGDNHNRNNLNAKQQMESFRIQNLNNRNFENKRLRHSNARNKTTKKSLSTNKNRGEKRSLAIKMRKQNINQSNGSFNNLSLNYQNNRNRKHPRKRPNPSLLLPVNKKRKTEISLSNNEHIIILIECRPTMNHQILRHQTKTKYELVTEFTHLMLFKHWMKDECKNNSMSIYIYDTKLRIIAEKEMHSAKNANAMWRSLESTNPIQAGQNQDFERSSWKMGLHKMINRIIQNSKENVSSKKKRIIFLTDAEKAYINIPNSEYKAIIMKKLKTNQIILDSIIFSKSQRTDSVLEEICHSSNGKVFNLQNKTYSAYAAVFNSDRISDIDWYCKSMIIE